MTKNETMTNHNKTKSITNDELKITNETVIRNSKFVIDKGYKQTKIGIIPNDWEVKRLEEIGTFFKGKGISKSELKVSGLNAVRYGEIYTTHNYFIKEFQSFISQETANNSFKLINGDLLFAGSGETLEDIGKSVAFIEEKEAYAGGDLIVLRPNKKIYNSLFLGFITNHDLFNKQTYRLGQGNSVVHIYSSGLKNTQLPIPPLPEQKAIADCLTTWDKGIEKLTALITAKKTQKKALMQSIFNDELRIKNWKKVKLGEVCTYKNGNSLENTITENGKHNLITLNSIDINGKLKKKHHRTNFYDNSLQKGDLIMILSDVAHGNFLGISELIPNNNFVLNQRVGRLRIKDDNICNNYFLKLYINYNQSYYKRMGQGSSQKNLAKNDILKFKLKLPPLSEQKEIANLLSTADKEIALLEQKLVALQRQKQGLMQVLLTGQLRITNDNQ